MNFSIWDDSVQMHPEQIKRLERATTSRLIPMRIDAAAQSGVFNGHGSKPYQTTLENCECGDFRKRHLPCKHIYRLAIELGLIQSDNVAKGTYGTDDKTLADHIKKYINTLSETDAHILATYFYEFANKYTHKLMRRAKVPDVVLSCEVFMDDDNIKEKIVKLQKKELIELLPKMPNLSNLRKDELIDLVLSSDNIDTSVISNLIVNLTVKDLYKPTLISLHRYVHKIYPQYRDYSFLHN